MMNNLPVYTIHHEQATKMEMINNFVDKRRVLAGPDHEPIIVESLM
jgi:hypothetical protein